MLMLQWQVSQPGRSVAVTLHDQKGEHPDAQHDETPIDIVCHDLLLGGYPATLNGNAAC
jgi:hypothetical protein